MSISEEFANAIIKSHGDTSEYPNRFVCQPRRVNELVDRILGLLLKRKKKEVVTDLGNHCLNLCFILCVSVLLLQHLPPVQTDGYEVSHLHAPEDCLGHTAKDGGHMRS